MPTMRPLKRTMRHPSKPFIQILTPYLLKASYKPIGKRWTIGREARPFGYVLKTMVQELHNPKGFHTDYKDFLQWEKSEGLGFPLWAEIHNALDIEEKEKGKGASNSLFTGIISAIAGSA